MRCRRTGDHQFIIVSKDDDFRQLAFLHGAPKVIWLRIGNGPTSEIQKVLTANVSVVAEFVESPEDALLVLPGLVLPS